MTAPVSPSDSTRLRLTVLIVIVVCLFSALLVRLWYLQVIDSSVAQAAAVTNGIQTIYVPAPRGRIFDRNGVLIVGNRISEVVTVEPGATITDTHLVDRLAAVLGETAKQVTDAMKSKQYSPYQPVPVASDVTPAVMLAIEENKAEFQGVSVQAESERYYPYGTTAANILGYVGQITASEYSKLRSKGYQPNDQIGQAGVESTYESVLRGQPGVEKVEVDAKGQVIGVQSYTAPVPGDDLRLSIDIHLQQEAQGAVNQGLQAAHSMFDTVTGKNYMAPAGSAVVEDPNTGQILALVTDPTYNPQDFVGGISQAKYNAYLQNPGTPLDDRSIEGEYAPGSTFKLVTGTAGLKYGIITPTSEFHDTGVIKLADGYTAHNDNYEAYGWINLPQAIEVSSDNFFNTIGIDLWDRRATVGQDALQNVARQYGFGAPTGINLPNESAGKVPDPASYERDHKLDPAVFQQAAWYTGDSDQLAIGQDELLVTPLQLVNAYSALANGGTLWVPQIALDAESPSGAVNPTLSGKVVKSFATHPIRKIDLAPAWRSALINGFQLVVNGSSGTASGDFGGTPLAADELAGKTGTAQVNAPRQDTSVFVSFGPTSNPKYVVDSFMEDSGYGASVAAPVVRQVWDQLEGLPLEPVAPGISSGGGQN